MNLFNQKSTQFFRCLIYNKKTSGGSATHHHRFMQYFEAYKFSRANRIQIWQKIYIGV